MAERKRENRRRQKTFLGQVKMQGKTASLVLYILLYVFCVVAGVLSAQTEKYTYTVGGICEETITANKDLVDEYSTEILTNLGFLEGLEADGKITYGSNVKEVTTQVSEASADAGIIYATDAFSAGLTVVDEAGADLCKQVIYPAAVLNTSKVPEAAQAFLDYLKTDACMEVFGEVGFSKAL